jgi:hypothetical protein
MTEGNYSNVGHRGPVYKGLGAMNPCDLSIYKYNYISLCQAYEKVTSVSIRKIHETWVKENMVSFLSLTRKPLLNNF